jgi:hypothetical protein
MEIFLDIAAISQENRREEDETKSRLFLQPSPGQTELLASPIERPQFLVK